MIAFLTDGDEIVATGVFEDAHHMAEQNAEAQEATEGELWWLTPEELAQAEAEARAELRRRKEKVGDVGCHWPAATWQDIARANNPRPMPDVPEDKYHGRPF